MKQEKFSYTVCKSSAQCIRSWFEFIFKTVTSPLLYTFFVTKLATDCLSPRSAQPVFHFSASPSLVVEWCNCDQCIKFRHHSLFGNELAKSKGTQLLPPNVHLGDANVYDLSCESPPNNCPLQTCLYLLCLQTSCTLLIIFVLFYTPVYLYVLSTPKLVMLELRFSLVFSPIIFLLSNFLALWHCDARRCFVDAYAAKCELLSRMCH